MGAMTPSPPLDASPTQRGVVNNENTEQAFGGPKRFVNDLKVDDTLIVAAASPVHTIEVGGDDFDVEVLPFHVGGFGEGGAAADLFETPGLRRYRVFSEVLQLGVREGFSIDLQDEDGDTRIALFADRVDIGNLNVDALEVSGDVQVGGTVDAGAFTVGGVPLTAGVDTLAAVGSTPNSGGGVIAGSTLTLQPADQTHPGVVSVLAQLFKGVKEFVDGLKANLITAAGTAALVIQSYLGSSQITVSETEILMQRGAAVARLSNSVGSHLVYNTSTYVTVGNNIVSIRADSYLELTTQFVFRNGGPFTLYAAGTSGVTETVRAISTRGDAGLKCFVGGTEADAPSDDIVLGQFAYGMRVAYTDVANGNPRFRVMGDGRAFFFGKLNTATISTRGTYGTGTLASDGPGDVTIHAAKGRAAVEVGSNSVTVTNDQVTTDSVVTLEWDGQAPYDNVTGKVLSRSLVRAAGSFTVKLESEDGVSPTASDSAWFCFTVHQ